MTQPSRARALALPLVFLGGALAVLAVGGAMLMRGSAPAPAPMPVSAKAQAPEIEIDHHAAVDVPLGDPYPLAACAVSGEKLGAMGEPLVETIDGREVRFCCASCPPKFKADPAHYLAKLDTAIIAQQKSYYPLATDLVTSEPLAAAAIDHVFRNRLVRFAGPDSLAKFTADPAPYMKSLDAAVLAAQKAAYPLKNCLVVQADAIGEGGMIPVDYVFANRLVRFCCAGCLPKFRADPLTYMSRLDAAVKP